MPRRTLSLKREALSELTPAELASVAGGKLTETCYSCMAFISCAVPFCLIDRDTLLCPV